MTEVVMDDLRSKPGYTTVLALNENGSALLKNIALKRKNADDDKHRPIIITKPIAASKLSGNAKRQYEIGRKAEMLYGLCFEEMRQASWDLKMHPYVKKKGSE